MKRLYSLLLLATCATLSANAVDYYLIGAFNHWTHKAENCKFTPRNDGTYILEYHGTIVNKVEKQGEGFKINDGSWDNKNNTFGGGVDNKLVKGYALALGWGGQEKNLVFGDADSVDNPVFILDPANHKLTYTVAQVSVPETYYLIGAFNDWAVADPAAKFEPQADGTQKLAYDGILAPGFKINRGSWENPDDNIGAPDDQPGIKPGEPKQLLTGNWSQNIVFESAPAYSNPVLVFDPKNLTLTLTGEAYNGPFTYYYVLHGQWNGPDWSNIKMNYDGKEYWFAEGVDVVGKDGKAEFGINRMVNETKAKDSWISADNGESNATRVEVAQGSSYPTTSTAGVNFAIPAGKHTIVYSPEQNKLFIHPYDPTVSSIGNLDAAAESPAVYYNLQGIRVDNPTQGIYIVRQGNKVSKVSF